MNELQGKQLDRYVLIRMDGAGTNPMTMGLLQTWEATGHKPEGTIQTWGADAFDAHPVSDQEGQEQQ